MSAELPAANRAHHVWDITEVVREIMKQNASDLETLAHCARVSRGLSEPALEVLWEVQHCLDKVLGLLRSSFKKVPCGINRFGLSHHDLVLCDAITDEEWARMLRYARLVRVFVSGEERVDGLAATVLAWRLNGQPLFPNLKQLTWTGSIEGSAMLPLLFSPMLRNVSLSLVTNERPSHNTSAMPPASEYVCGTALAILHSRAPNVIGIELWTSASLCTVDRIVNFRYLSSLNMGPVDDPGAVLELCRSLPRLTELTLDIAYYIGVKPRPTHSQLPETLLYCLRRLTLSGPPGIVVSFVEAVHAPFLHLLDLKFEAVMDLWKRCLEVILARFGASLRNFTAGLEDGREVDNCSFHDWFSSLYNMRGLRQVSIESLYETSLNIVPQDLEDMASAWPQLRFLGLPSSVEDDGSSAFPITALQSLAANCPRLRRLAIPLPHHAPLVGLTLPPVSASQTYLKEICILSGRWPQEMREKCIAYLRLLFPCANTVLMNEEFGDMDDDW
ncbi:hypothetical protein ONZ51_g3870 [Trametes cubensis]|uniref:Uncharacterized protein n=1 Tax=Trametes cubensis TaxID=1111947 RepID=A0AAD7TWZ6_9APHY|nr:hypothetical protein ONZ51_g3870 [Trametes cubensis]